MRPYQLSAGETGNNLLLDLRTEENNRDYTSTALLVYEADCIVFSVSQLMYLPLEALWNH